MLRDFKDPNLQRKPALLVAYNYSLIGEAGVMLLTRARRWI